MMCDCTFASGEIPAHAPRRRGQLTANGDEMSCVAPGQAFRFAAGIQPRTSIVL
jgi:hypothetical protein